MFTKLLRFKNQTGMKVCFSEPSLLIEKTLDHLIKRTAGITVL